MKNTKRIISMFLAVVMVFLMLPIAPITINASAQNALDSTIEKYRLDEINGITNQILYDYVADSFDTDAIEGSFQKTQAQKTLSIVNKGLGIASAGVKLIGSAAQIAAVLDPTGVGALVSAIANVCDGVLNVGKETTGAFIEADSNEQLMIQLNAMSKQIYEISEQINAFAEANRSYISDMVELINDKSDLKDYKAVLQEFAIDIFGDERFKGYGSYYSWQKELYKSLDEVILAEQKLEKKETLSQPISFYYDKLYLAAMKSDDLYDYLTATAFEAVTLPEVAYRYYLLNNVVDGKKLLTYQEITERCIALSQDWYTTYAMSQICLEMCYMHQLETIMEDTEIAPPYDATVYKDSPATDGIKYGYKEIYDFLIDPLKNIEAIEIGLAQHYARILCLDESYIYEPCIYGDSSYSGEKICYTIQYEEIVAEGDHDAVKKNYGTDLSYFSRTNNSVSTGDTLYMNLLPETFSDIFDVNKISFESDNTDIASVNNAGVVNVVGEAGDSFTISMLYDGVVVYYMEFKIIDCKIAATTNTTIEIKLGAYLSGTYSNVNIQIADSYEDLPAYIVLDGATITGSIYSSNSRPIYIISKDSSNTGKTNSITAPNNTIAINAPNAEICISGDAELTIIGGSGSNGKSYSGKHDSTGDGYDGGNGKVGKVAITAESLHIICQNKLHIKGGQGGKGGNGEGGNSFWLEDHNGGNGGAGGSGSYAISLTGKCHINSINTIIIEGGSGGNGGTGGAAGNGGKRGYGGDGGDGGDALECGGIIIQNNSEPQLLGGSGGSGGSGRSSGSSGEDGNSGADESSICQLANNHIYELIKGSLSWDSAKSACEALGGHLVTITSAEEQKIVTTLASGNKVWLGASDVNVEGTFVWVTGEEFTYTNWSSGEPNNNNGDGDYLQMYTSGLWDDCSDASKYYICEWDTPITPPPYDSQYIRGEKYFKYTEYADQETTSEILYSLSEYRIDTSKTSEETVENIIVTRLIPVSGTSMYKKQEFPILVDEKKPEQLYVYTKPRKTEYQLNDTFDPIGLNLVLLYDNGDVEIIDGTQCDVAFDSSSLDETKATVNYLGVSTDVDVSVAPFDFYGANIKLGDSLTIYFYLEKADFDGTDYYVTVTRSFGNSKADEVYSIPMSEFESYNESLWRIPYKGIAAKEMGDKITMVVYNSDGVAVSTPKVDSIEDYCYRGLANTSFAQKYKTALVDMLNFGAACQTYFDYAPDALVNADLTSEQSGWASDMPSVTDERVKGTNYSGGSVTVESRTLLNFYFAGMTTDMKAHVTYTNNYGDEKDYWIAGSDFVYNSGAGLYGVAVNTLAMGDYDCLVTVTVYNADNTEYGYAKDSISSYLARISGEPFISTAKAMLSAKIALHG